MAYTKEFSRGTYKVYFDASLCNLALASGYPQNSVGVNFTHTHNFLLEVWEALYFICLSLCLINNDFLESTCNWKFLSTSPADDISVQHDLNEMFADLSEKYNYQESFEKFHD